MTASHSSVETSSRTLRAFSRARPTADTIEPGFFGSSTRNSLTDDGVDRQLGSANTCRGCRTASRSSHAAGLRGRRLEQPVVGDVEHAGGVLGPLDVATRPEEALGVPGEHQGAPPVLRSASTHVSFDPPPWRRVHDERALAQRDPGEAARDHLDALARQHERAQVDVAALEVVADERGCRDSGTTSCAM